jgi:hypothetical protein
MQQQQQQASYNKHERRPCQRHVSDSSKKLRVTRQGRRPDERMQDVYARGWTGARMSFLLTKKKSVGKNA